MFIAEKSANIIDIVEFKKTTYYFRADGIVIIKIKDNVHLELEDSKEEQQMLYSEKEDYIPLRVIINPGKHASVSKEVRDYSNHPDNAKMILAEAIVVQSMAHKIMANFIKNFYKTPMQIKIFNDEESAVNWLSSFS